MRSRRAREAPTPSAEDDAEPAAEKRDRQKHDQVVERVREAVDANAEYGYRNVIVMAGQRDEIPDDVGLEAGVSCEHAEDLRHQQPDEPKNPSLPDRQRDLLW